MFIQLCNFQSHIETSDEKSEFILEACDPIKRGIKIKTEFKTNISFPCEVCTRTFTNIFNLKTHIQYNHTIIQKLQYSKIKMKLVYHLIIKIFF